MFGKYSKGFTIDNMKEIAPDEYVYSGKKIISIMSGKYSKGFTIDNMKKMGLRNTCTNFLQAMRL